MTRRLTMKAVVYVVVSAVAALLVVAMIFIGVVALYLLSDEYFGTPLYGFFAIVGGAILIAGGHQGYLAYEDRDRNRRG